MRKATVYLVVLGGKFLQTVRSDRSNAFEVRDNFRAMFKEMGSPETVDVVRGVVTYDPRNVVKL